MVGHFTKRIRAMQQQFNKTADRIVSRDKKGMIPKHEALTDQCEICGKRHTKNEHRFHGAGSHERTHGDEERGREMYVTENIIGKKGSKAIAKMQKELASLGTPRTKKPTKKNPWGGDTGVRGPGASFMGVALPKPKKKR